MRANARSLFVFCCSLFIGSAQAQELISSKGTEFWLGFMRNYDMTERLTLHLSADEETTGTVSLPLQGWSQDFTVPAHGVAVVEVPVSAMHFDSEVIETKGVQVTSDAPISVHAENYELATAEATIVYPVASLGREYRVMAYPGFPAVDAFASEFLVVATEDGTEVEITPKANTLGAHAADQPFLVSLNAGESYQVCALTAGGDLTGSVVRTTEQNGPCRRIAVFGGSVCPQVPAGCAACDHLFEQQLAVPSWGMNYFSVPLAGSTGYTYRILAHEDNTTVLVDGGNTIVLNAGQVVELNHTSEAHCFSGDRPFSLGQYMESGQCSGNSDPFFVLLNAADQEAYDVTFLTLGSDLTDHFINVVVNSADIGSVALDGSAVADSAFTAFPACDDRSYAQLPLDSGQHRITCVNGLIGVLYGLGMSYESYGLSLGSFAEVVDPCATVLSEPDATGHLMLSPNPAAESFMLSGLVQARASRVMLFDAWGAQVKRWDGVLPREGLWVGDLPAGIYTVEVAVEGRHREHLKLVIE